VKPEPTPGHVRRAAADDFQTARWADAVERAVFGGGEVDARMEGEIERMAPPEPRPGPAGVVPGKDRPDAPNAKEAAAGASPGVSPEPRKTEEDERR
jgi:hypothetical protein